MIHQTSRSTKTVMRAFAAHGAAVLSVFVLSASGLVAGLSVAGSAPAGASLRPHDAAADQIGFASDLVDRANDERNARGLPSLNKNAQFMADAASRASQMAASGQGSAGSTNATCPSGNEPPAGTYCEEVYSFAVSGLSSGDGSDGIDSTFMNNPIYRQGMLAAGNADMGIGVGCSATTNEAYVSEIFGWVEGSDQTMAGFSAANSAQNPATISATTTVAGQGVGNPWYCPGEIDDQNNISAGGQETIAGNSPLPTPTPPPNGGPPPPPSGGGGGVGTLTGPITGMASTVDGGGYWLVNNQGAVYPYGDAGAYGSMAGKKLNAPMNHIVSSHDGKGYWLVASDGGVFSFGDAPFYGSTGALRLNAPVVDIAPTPDGGGYWLVASDGGIFSFGDAPFYGSMGGRPLNKPVVAMAGDPHTGGYWLVATDGGIFSFGAPFYGSTGAIKLNQPINAMAATGDGGGYWMNANDGGIFNFGDAPYLGSTGSSQIVAPIVGLAADPATGGYWQVDQKGNVYAYLAPKYNAA
jgi:hypothetical protein